MLNPDLTGVPDALDTASSRYTRVAMVLHWLIAILILFNLAVGFFMEGMAPDARKIVISAHLSSGVTVLALTVVRIVWRITHRPPSPLRGLGNWERKLAKLVNLFFYFAMILTPLSGWAIISANPPAGSAGAISQQMQADAALAQGKQVPPVRVSGKSRFWWFAPLPPIAPIANIGALPEGLEVQHRMHEQSAQVHGYLSFLLIALLILHISGALKHQFIDRMPQLERMGFRTQAHRL